MKDKKGIPAPKDWQKKVEPEARYLAKKMGMVLRDTSNDKPEPDPYSLQNRKWGKELRSIEGFCFTYSCHSRATADEISVEVYLPRRDTKEAAQADLDRFMNANGGTLE